MVRLLPGVIIVVLLFTACRTTEPVLRAPVPAATAEARALWVARMAYRTPEDVRTIIRNAADFNFNVVLFQVRGNATAFYSSDLEPWAWELTGEDPSTLGTDPGWDPLQLACDEAHARGLELHAWVNVLPAWRETVAPPDSVGQLWTTNREWFMQNAGGEVMWPQDWWTYWYAFLDPGVPEVKQHLHDVFLEIVDNYPVDGLHYDYVRYPSEVGDWAYNPTSVARFAEHYKDYDDPSPDT
ncbi:MAG: family 10 glycosylhydrolase, partial [Rhodothermales bacterium]|nr:family 10 glycosylhydrolase [Rhodothermales bacterium]